MEHWQVNVNRYSKVEGFYFINRPNRVYLTLDDLLHQQATHQARVPLPPPSVPLSLVLVMTFPNC